MYMSFILLYQDNFVILPVESVSVEKIQCFTTIIFLRLSAIVRFNLERSVIGMTRLFKRQMYFNLFELCR